MSRKHFGTDGVRGVANQKLTPELAFSLGQAAGRWLIANGQPRRAVLGRDTRKSGTMLEASLAAGLCSVGVDVVSLGVAPTPAIAFAARTGNYGLGGIVSASHNPAPDNGIKFVGHDGRKLPDTEELRIEALMSSEEERPTGAGVGTYELDRSELEGYMNLLESAVPERLEGMHIAVDAAHGAAYELGPQILHRLGADVVLMGASPDGLNINAEGGATKPQTIQDFTKGAGAAIGVAFDGDADRAVFSDEQGRLINGDRTIGIWAAHYQERAELDPPVVVGTVMSNGGFEAYMTARGIRLERAPVGDKYVAERIERTSALVGGEQSGHIIFPRRGPTGDGLMTMLELLRVLKVEDRPASSFYDDYQPWPQIMVNMAVASKDGWETKIKAELEQGEKDLNGHGRLVVRPSGTQPVIRVMVEADDYELRDRVCDNIVAAMERELGGHVEGRVDLTYALGD
ncbi:phosphoglucosamine mutase [Fimbriimonas ginsengisoli]|uniref:Phosphoglucosamine mutase n=1 Tax=Fimbriimonas ginsengisoli Gsoil 348 TaxID=661478 RepID=A0A068NWS8_FIMGI|nr:phosphoglucosamine mutase [Fimbriimonas ginsengisoli]AIE87827.1 phosphoglucosamine mutase [Fimbriimonas ginsengisoli Gsoil 348]